MALKEVITWRVSVAGEITVQATDGDNALAEAKTIFKKMDEHISWTLAPTKTFIEAAE